MKSFIALSLAALAAPAPAPTPLLASRQASSTSLDFVLDQVIGFDQRVPSTSHAISFNVTNDNPFSENGGGGKATCSVFWTTPSPPDCFAQCDSIDPVGTFFFRVTPGSFSYAGNFDLDITQVYVNELVNKNNATVAVREGQGGYQCSRGGQSTQCRVLEGVGSGFTQPFQRFFGEGEPDPRC
ncbi:MAG: hypothetical protein Q9160_002983 [Pyrenula sp. 1 TL-2023]